MVTWILWMILGILILLGIGALLMLKTKKKRPTDYYSLFFMGVIWVPFGLIMMIMVPEFALGWFFFVIGWVYFVQGIAHKEDWKKNRQANLIKKDWLRWIIIGLLALGVAVGIVFYLGIK